MPSKTKGLKAHHRTASASTAKLGSGLNHTIGGGANGAFTTRTRSAEKIRRNGSDLQQHNARSAFPHVTHNNTVAAAQQHTNSNAPPTTIAPRRGLKVLEIETNSQEDDSEWVSSESGAVTPADDYHSDDAPQTPKEISKGLPTVPNDTKHSWHHNPAESQGKPPDIAATPRDNSAFLQPITKPPPKPQLTLQQPTPEPDQPPTPKAEYRQITSAAQPSRVPSETKQPPPQEPSQAASSHRRPQPPTRSHSHPRPQSMADLPRVDTAFPKSTNLSPQCESGEAGHSRVESAVSERPRTRPPSMRSIRSVVPHPLIRTRSYAPATPTLTSPPAFSPTPISPRSVQSAGGAGSDASPPDANVSYFPRLRRQNSQSSVNSVATLPLPRTSSSSAAAAAKTMSSKITATRERPRTMSNTSAALSSLAATAAHNNAAHVLGTASRPPSPIVPYAFPPQLGKPVHPLIPDPLAPPHISATLHSRPMTDAIRRVIKRRAVRAKELQAEA